MTTGIDIVYDATHANIAHLPPFASYAGYVTGSPDIAWTTADFSKYPDAIRIDQTPVSGPWDATADVDDYENGAVTLGELGPRAKLRMAAYRDAMRPGQRTPVVYASASNVTPVVDALIAAGVTSGVGLWVAHWNVSEAVAIADVIAASGPFPIHGFQFTDNSGVYDTSVFSVAWLSTRSANPAPPTSPTYVGVVSFMQAGIAAKAGEFEIKQISSTDSGHHWQ
jgi:hypothetical protein